MPEGERVVAISPLMVARLSPLLEAIGLALAAGIEVNEQGLRTTLLAAGYDLSPDVLYEVLPELLHWSDLLRALRWQPSMLLREATLEALTNRGLRPAHVDRVLDLVTVVGGGTDRNHVVEDVPRPPGLLPTEKPRTLEQLPALRKPVGASHPSPRAIRRPAPPPSRTNAIYVPRRRTPVPESLLLQLALPLVILFGLILRVWLAVPQSAWLDEAWSLQKMARLPWGDIYNTTRLDDTHSPLYYAVLHAWVDIIGFGVFQGRLLSVVLGTAAIPVLYRLTEILFDKATALTAAVLLAISPIANWYSDEIRMYAATSLFALLTVYLLVRAAEEPQPQVRWWGWYAVCAPLSFAFDSTGAFLPVAVNLYYVMLLAQRKAPLRPWLASNFVAVLLAIPILLFVRSELARNSAAITFPAPTLESVWLSILNLVSINSDPFWAGLTFTALFIAGLGGLVYDYRDIRLRNGYVLLAFIIGTPIALPLAFSLVHPLYDLRTVQTAVFGLLILYARGMVVLLRPRMPVGILAFIAIACLNAGSLHAAAATTINEDWRGLAQYADREAGVDSMIVLDPYWLLDPFNLYWDSYHSRATQHDYPPITSDSQAAQLFKGFNSVWLVVYGNQGSPPVDPGTTYLQSHYRLLPTPQFVGLTLFHYMVAGPVKSTSSAVLPDHIHVGSTL